MAPGGHSSMKKTVKYRKQLEMGGFQTVNHAKNREVS